MKTHQIKQHIIDFDKPGYQNLVVGDDLSIGNDYQKCRK
jgi:hypothetical protein